MPAAATDPWSRLSPRVVMVARYAQGDGIGRYADQLAAAYGEGREFVRVGIPEGPGDYHRTLHRAPWALWLLRDARRADDVVVHYHPHYYVRGGAVARLGAHVSWALLSRCRRVVFVAHEPDPAGGSRLEEAVRRWAWRRAPRVIFHSAWERERHRARFGQRRDQDLAVTGHGDFYSTMVAAGREEARAALGLGAEPTILLMIGFLSAADPDKGYDRAIEAVRAVDDPRLQLHIVGSPIREGPGVDALLDALRAAADGDRIVLHEQFVDDETFDLWVRAADAVLTPYRTASSSGVIARAQLLGTRVITSDAGGLAEQAGAGDVVVADDEGLREAIRRTLDGR